MESRNMERRNEERAADKRRRAFGRRGADRGGALGLEEKAEAAGKGSRGDPGEGGGAGDAGVTLGASRSGGRICRASDPYGQVPTPLRLGQRRGAMPWGP